MRRRDFISALGGAAAWPITARAQQPERMRRIGVLMGYPEAQSEFASFMDELRKLGWVDGRNLRIDTRWGIPADPLSQSTPTTAALLQETRIIPIVFAIVADPVGSGFVASLARPGGNATGFVVTESSLGGKWLELLREIAPRVTRVAALFNPAMAPYAEYWLDSFKAAAASFAVEAIRAPIHDSSELESIIAAQAHEPNSGLFVLPDAFTFAYRVEIVSLAARYRLPAVYAFRFFTALGGLLSYGNDLNDNFRRAASYADRILKGAKPSDLPVQAPVKFELVINLKTAKTLGLDVPLQLQQLADEVIE